MEICPKSTITLHGLNLSVSVAGLDRGGAIYSSGFSGSASQTVNWSLLSGNSADLGGDNYAFLGGEVNVN